MCDGGGRRSVAEGDRFGLINYGATATSFKAVLALKRSNCARRFGDCEARLVCGGIVHWAHAFWRVYMCRVRGGN